MGTEIDRIVRLLEKTFDKQPWYGDSMMKTLSGISADIINRKHGPTHSIAELVVHMISWRVFVTKRLQGEDSFQVTDEMNFPKPGSWDAVINDLYASQKALIEVVKIFPESKLNELVPNATHKYTYYTLIHGGIQHDIYHLGQIALLKKSWS
jgi:uncharacterized damage-inducible protein DinB